MTNQDFSSQLNPPAKWPIGEHLIKSGLISRWQLKRALAHQTQAYQPLGQIFVNMGLTSPQSIEFSLSQLEPKQKGSDNSALHLGELLIHLGILNASTVQDILKQQQRSQEAFGEILLKENILKEDELEDILSIQYWLNNREFAIQPKLGELLIKYGKLTWSQLKKALQVHHKTQRKLGEILIDLEWISKKDLHQVLRIQKRLLKLSLISALGMGALSACSPPQVPLQPYPNAQGALSVQMANGFTLNPTSSLNGPFKTLNLDSGKIRVYPNGSKVLDNVPFALQGNDNTCGQAVLTMLLQYWGRPANYQQLVNKTNAWNLATTAEVIQEYLRNQGLSAQTYRKATINNLIAQVNKGRPTNVLLDFGSLSQAHYVVVVGYNQKKGTLIMHDSLEGPYVEMDMQLFESMWRNQALRKLPLPGMDNYDQIMFEVFS